MSNAPFDEICWRVPLVGHPSPRRYGQSELKESQVWGPIISAPDVETAIAKALYLFPHAVVMGKVVPEHGLGRGHRKDD